MGATKKQKELAGLGQLFLLIPCTCTRYLPRCTPYPVQKMPTQKAKIYFLVKYPVHPCTFVHLLEVERSKYVHGVNMDVQELPQNVQGIFS